MSRIRHRLLLVLLAATLAAGCETVVDVPPPEHTPQLVVQSFFAGDSIWSARVTHTVPYLSEERPGFVDDATVEVWEGGRPLVTPTRVDSGTYVAIGPVPDPERPYTLRVEAPGYPSVEGTDRLPAAPPVAALRDTTLMPSGPDALRRLTRVRLTLDDAPGPDYYGLMVVQALWRERRSTGEREPLPPSLFTFLSSEPVLGEGELDFLDTDQSRYRHAFFTDGLFDGTTYTLDFDLVYGAPDPEAEVVVRRAFAVVVLTVSEDFYRYWQTSDRQERTNENPFAEPLRVHSNLEGGFGIFAGYRARVFPLSEDATGTDAVDLRSLCRLAEDPPPMCSSR